MTPALRAQLDLVVVNVSTLEACPQHSFTEQVNVGPSVFTRWKCANCGGTVRSTEKRWYERGIQHSTPVESLKAPGNTPHESHR